jgi:hypothetical protein
VTKEMIATTDMEGTEPRRNTSSEGLLMLCTHPQRLQEDPCRTVGMLAALELGMSVEGLIDDLLLFFSNAKRILPRDCGEPTIIEEVHAATGIAVSELERLVERGERAWDAVHEEGR